MKRLLGSDQHRITLFCEQRSDLWVRSGGQVVSFVHAIPLRLERFENAHITAGRGSHNSLECHLREKLVNVVTAGEMQQVPLDFLFNQDTGTVVRDGVA